MSPTSSPSKASGRVPIRRRKYRPAGHRILHEPVAETDSAVRFRYYAWILWIPRSALVKVGAEYTTPAWAIDTAKEHPSARRFSSDAEAAEYGAELRGEVTGETESVFAAKT